MRGENDDFLWESQFLDRLHVPVCTAAEDFKISKEGNCQILSVQKPYYHQAGLLNPEKINTHHPVGDIT